MPALRVLLLARVPMSCLPAPPALAPWAMVIEPPVMAMTPFAPLVLVQPLMLVQSLGQSLGQSPGLRQPLVLGPLPRRGQLPHQLQPPWMRLLLLAWPAQLTLLAPLALMPPLVPLVPLALLAQLA